MVELYQFDPMLGPAEDFPAGSVEWAKRISSRLQTGTRFISRHSAQHIGETLKQIWEAHPRPWEVFPEGRPYGTPEDYCLAVTGIKWPVLLQTLSEFVPETELNATLARAQVVHRGQGARNDLLPYVVRKSSEDGGDGGNSSTYLLRRLARDDPDILTAYERGEFPSVRAAAKAAGIVKDPTPLELLRRAWKHATADERDTFLAEIESHDAPAPPVQVTKVDQLNTRPTEEEEIEDGGLALPELIKAGRAWLGAPPGRAERGLRGLGG